jgi:hypothetical protein
MVANCKSHIPHAPKLHINDYNFEIVAPSIFVYLGSIVDETNYIKEKSVKESNC